MKADTDPLSQWQETIIAHTFVEFRLADKKNGQHVLPFFFQVGQQSDLLQQINGQDMSLVKDKQYALAPLMATLEKAVKLYQEKGLVAIPMEAKFIRDIGEKFVPLENRIVQQAKMDVLLQGSDQRLQQRGFPRANICCQDKEAFIAEDAIP